MLVVARNTPATAALSSISTATALGSLPRITGGRGRGEGRRRRREGEEEGKGRKGRKGEGKGRGGRWEGKMKRGRRMR